MQKFILPLLLFFTLPAPGQPGNRERQPVKTKLVIDSAATVKLKQLSDSLEKAKEETVSLQQKESLRRGNEYFLQFQKERKAKEKKAAMIRIGIGIFFLVILLTGLRRRIKK